MKEMRWVLVNIVTLQVDLRAETVAYPSIDPLLGGAW